MTVGFFKFGLNCLLSKNVKTHNHVKTSQKNSENKKIYYNESAFQKISPSIDSLFSNQNKNEICKKSTIEESPFQKMVLVNESSFSIVKEYNGKREIKLINILLKKIMSEKLLTCKTLYIFFIFTIIFFRIKWIRVCLWKEKSFANKEINDLGIVLKEMVLRMTEQNTFLQIKKNEIESKITIIWQILTCFSLKNGKKMK